MKGGHPVGESDALDVFLSQRKVGMKYVFYR